MAEGFALKAEVRERTGKGAARALRRNGQIPAVIYGNNEPPLPIAIPYKETSLALYGGGFLTNVWQIDVGSGKTEQVLARDYQREPVKDILQHVDFLRVTARSRVTVEVPVNVVGEADSPGLEGGGVLQQIEFTLSIEAGATKIPDSLEISVAGADVGATLTSEDVSLPDGVTFTAEEAFPIVTITAPVAEPVDEEPIETEVIGEGEAGEEGETAEGEGGEGDAAASDEGGETS